MSMMLIDRNRNTIAFGSNDRTDHLQEIKYFLINVYQDDYLFNLFAEAMEQIKEDVNEEGTHDLSSF